MRTIWTLHKDQTLAQVSSSEVRPLLQEGNLVWVDLTQPTPDDFAWLSETFSFHPLAIEDAQIRTLHPKLDEYPGYLFMLAHGVHPQATPTNYKPIQCAFFLSEQFLVSIYPAEIARLNTDATTIQRLLLSGTTHMMAHLLSLFAADFTPFVYRFGDELEELESRLEENAEKLLDSTLAFKRSLVHLRQTAYHQRELLSRLLNHKEEALQREHFFFSDIQDRIVLLIDEVAALRELTASIIESCTAISSHRSSAVMKILTAVSTIFFPLNFVVNLYGMNFEHVSPWNMPELIWFDGYPMFILFMLGLILALVYAFKRRDWL